MKVLTIEPLPADPRLREDMALLADCALPPELRVSARLPGAGPGGQEGCLGMDYGRQALCTYIQFFV